MLNRPETQPPPLPAHSVPAAPDITFQWEQFSAIAREVAPLFKAHWAEIALNQDKIALDPDWDRYYALERSGTLCCWTARTSSKMLVGYIFWMVVPNLHYATVMFAGTDIFWLHPAYREGWTGIHLFKNCLHDLKAIGAAVVHIRVKDTFQTGADGRGRVGKFLVRMLKAKPIETVYELLL